MLEHMKMHLFFWRRLSCGCTSKNVKYACHRKQIGLMRIILRRSLMDARCSQASISNTMTRIEMLKVCIARFKPSLPNATRAAHIALEALSQFGHAIAPSSVCYHPVGIRNLQVAAMHLPHTFYCESVNVDPQLV